MGVTVGAPGRKVGAIGAGRIVALPSHNDGAVTATNDQGLVARSVAGSRHDEDTRQHFGFAVELLVDQTRSIDEFRQGVVRRLPGRFQFNALGKTVRPVSSGLPPQ